MNIRTFLLGAALGPLWALTAHAQPAYVIGNSYSFQGETAITPCSSAGVPVAGAAALDAPNASIFRLVDTLTAGDAVIRFWKWPTGNTRRASFNYQGGDSTATAFYFLLPKTARRRTKQEKAGASFNGQVPIDPVPAPVKVDPLVLDTNRSPLGKDRAFIYSIGTNFDFIDNVQVAKTYHDLRAWLPQLAKRNNGFVSNLGLEFGFNRFRTFSTPDSATNEYRDVRPLQVVANGDTTYVPTFITNTVKDKITARFDNIGLMLNPTIRLTAVDRKDVYLGATVNLEWQRSVLDKTIVRTYNEVTTEEAPDNWARPYELNYGQLPPGQENFRTTTDNFYGGLGLRLMYRDDFGTLNMRACMGYSYTMITPGNEKTLEASEGIYYALQAEIIESKVSGVKLGTEIRGFFVDNPADPIRAFPRFSLYIAKEFRLSKIAELLSAN